MTLDARTKEILKEMTFWRGRLKEFGWSLCGYDPGVLATNGELTADLTGGSFQFVRDILDKYDKVKAENTELHIKSVRKIPVDHFLYALYLDGKLPHGETLDTTGIRIIHRDLKSAQAALEIIPQRLDGRVTLMRFSPFDQVGHEDPYAPDF